MSTPYDDPPPFDDDETVILPRARRSTFVPPRPDHPRPSRFGPTYSAVRTRVVQGYTAALNAVRRPRPGNTGAARLRDPRVWVSAVVAIIVGLVLLLALLPGAPPHRSVVGKAFQGNLVQTLTTSGALSSGVYNLNFFASGRVAAIDVRVGQAVQAGDVLAQLDETQLQDALNTAQAQLTVAQVAYNNALIGLKNAQDNQAAVDAAAQDAYNAVATPQAGQPTPTPQQLQQAQDKLNEAETQAQNQVNAAQAQVNLTKSQVSAAATNVIAAQHNLANSILRAPVAGQVAEVDGNIGEAVGVGGATGPLIVLVNLKTLQASGLVDELSIAQVQVGWPVTFTVRAFPQQTFYGTVATISPIPHQAQGDVSYLVSVAIDAQSASQARLFPEMTVPHITITTNEAFGAILIPNAALAFARDATQNGQLAASAGQAATQQAQQLIVDATDPALKAGQAAYVAQWQHGKLVAVPVVISFSDGTDTVVLAGLKVGDPVVLSA
jgi:multidrug resistance efflux pump